MTAAHTVRWARHAPGALRAFAERQGAFARALLLEGAPPPLDLAPEVGLAWFPVVFSEPWDALDGCLVAVRTDGRGRALPDNTQDQVFALIAALAVPISPDRRPPLTFGGLPGADDAGALDGASYGVAALVAAVSRVLGRPPSGPIVASAGCAPTGATDVVHVARKRAILALEAPHIPLWTAEVEPLADALARWFGPTWAADLAEHLDISPEQLTREAWQHYQRRQYQDALGRAQEALRAGAQDGAAGRARWIEAAMRMHAGDTDAAWPALWEAREVVARHTDPADAEILRLDAYLGVALIDLGRPKAARAHLARALEGLGEVAGEAKRQAWTEACGTLARALVLDHDLEGARATLEDDGPATPDGRATSSERARCQSDLAEVYRRLGDLAAAESWLDRARRSARDMPADYKRMTLRYLDLYAARCGVKHPLAPVDDADPSDWPQPLEAGESALAADPATFGDWLTVAWGAMPGRAHRMALCGLLARAMERWPEAWQYAGFFWDLAHNTSQADGPMEPEVRAALERAMTEPAVWIERAPY